MELIAGKIVKHLNLTYRTGEKFRAIQDFENFAGSNSTFHGIIFVSSATHEKREIKTPRNFLPVRYHSACCYPYISLSAEHILLVVHFISPVYTRPLIRI